MGLGSLSPGKEGVGSSAIALAACGRSLQVPLLTRSFPDFSAGKRIPSIIIAQTDGTLTAGPFHETKKQVSPIHRYQHFALIFGDLYSTTSFYRLTRLAIWGLLFSAWVYLPIRKSR